MSPEFYLILVLAVLLAVVTHSTLRSLLQRKQLRDLARQWHMHFAAGDRLRIAQRAARHFPVPGAASIQVRNLIFRTEENRHQYLFTVDFTIGIIRGKVGRSSVAGFEEPVTRGGRTNQTPPVLFLAPRNLSLPAAYRHVLEHLGRESRQ
ncbi:MAG: hypothetical protein ABSB33_09845 [Tepidisphaeraceae bacterium]